MASCSKKAPASKFVPSGYDYEFVLDVPEEYICNICLSPMWKPVQTKPCGHRFCKDCLEEANKRRRPPECPVDRLQLNSKQDIYEDKAAERQILSFEIKCPSERCQWQGELGDFKDHTCGPVSADFTAKCPNQCGEKLKREKIEHHVKHECPLTSVPCVYQRIGCNVKKPRKDMEKHMEKSITQHFNITCERLLLLEKENLELKAKQQEMEHQCNNLKMNLQKKEEKKNDISKEIGDLKNDMKKQLEQRKKLDQTRETLTYQYGELTKELRNFKKEIKQINNRQNEKLDTLRTEKEELELSNTYMRTSMNTLRDNWRDHLNDARETIHRELTAFAAQASSKNKDFYFIVIMALWCFFAMFGGVFKEGLVSVANDIHEAKFIFNIENFGGILRQAKSTHKDMVHTEEFYIKKYSYKFKVTVYPNGYGRGKNTHVSLFLQIARGKYDAVLTWPFNEAIRIFVLKNLQQTGNINETIYPHQISSKCFQRPLQTLNEPFGSETFASHEKLKLENFLSSGSLFLKIEVWPIWTAFFI